MEVTQDKEFKPITIVLETEEEAYALWHRLNVSLTNLCDGTHHTLDLDVIREIDVEMFAAFDDIYQQHTHKKKGG